MDQIWRVQWRRHTKRKNKGRGRETDLEVVALPSFEGVQSNSGVAQGMEEVGPCSPNQMGTFLEQGRRMEKYTTIN